MILIPAIDLMDGQCVRLFQGGFNTVTYYDFSPTDLANKYEKMGFSKLHIVDLDGIIFSLTSDLIIVYCSNINSTIFI